MRLKKRGRLIKTSDVIPCQKMLNIRLTPKMIASGVTHAYKILDTIDNTLVSQKIERLSKLVELANVSSIFGNIISSGIANSSSGIYKKNAPHTYPDLLACHKRAKDVEIKVSLETNKPKGHLAKKGYYLTFRYVLGDIYGSYVKGKENRKDVIWIYEIRFGYLQKKDFNLSSTAGDSGKTAVINATGMQKLNVIYENTKFSPYKN